MISYGFTVGSLPIRYLGLPLMSRKLKISEYEPFIASLKQRFTSWGTEFLTFAGRTQLLATVIAGKIKFWSSTFFLLKGCIRQIESLCSRFLWSGNITQRCYAKVAWSSVCLPEAEGGLGLRSILIWNKTLCLGYIWNIFSDSASMWAKWKHHHKLRRLSLWAVEPFLTDSWVWKSLLKIRPSGCRFIITEISNVRSTSFWHDTWTPLGPLINALGNDGCRRLRVNETHLSPMLALWWDGPCLLHGLTTR